MCAFAREITPGLGGPCDKLPLQDRGLIFKREEEFSDPRGNVQRPEGERELSHKARRHRTTERGPRKGATKGCAVSH